MMRPDRFLLFVARRKTNGANVHRAIALIRGYEIAIEVAQHPRSKGPEARMRAELAADALREFCKAGR